MAETDVFPVAPDYAVTRSREGNIVRHRAESGEEFLRSRAPLRRVFDLTFRSRPYADWNSIEDFRLTHRETHFTFVDVSKGNRDYSVVFAGEPQYSEIGNEQVDIRLQLIEAVNKPLRNYPQTPLLSMAASEIKAVSDGKVVVYPGYGFQLTGVFITSVELDGVVVCGGGPTVSHFTAALALHTVKVKPQAGQITTFKFVH